MARSYVVDVSSYQSDTEAYFQRLKAKGAKSAIVKLTEGTSYVSPKAASQIKNALKVFGTCHLYHFYHGNALAEAKYFLTYVKKYGMDTSTYLAIDVEASGLPANTTSGVNTFLKYLYDKGYHNLLCYGSASWFEEGRIVKSHLLSGVKIWCAAYNNTAPGIDGVDIWQYTDNFKSLGVDGSIDFNSILSSSSAVSHSSIKSVDKYYTSSKIALYEVTGSYVSVYKSDNFSDAVKSEIKYAKGSRIWASAVKSGSITHLKLQYANGYISSNTKFVKRIKFA